MSTWQTDSFNIVHHAQTRSVGTLLPAHMAKLMAAHDKSTLEVMLPRYQHGCAMQQTSEQLTLLFSKHCNNDAVPKALSAVYSALGTSDVWLEGHDGASGCEIGTYIPSTANELGI